MFQNFFLSLSIIINNLFSHELIGIVDKKKNKIVTCAFTKYLPLFFYIPYIEFNKYIYIYKLKDKYFFYENTKNIKISPVISEIVLIDDNKNEINFSHINNKYSHNMYFWIILKLENRDNCNINILKFTKNIIINNITRIVNINNIYDKRLNDIFNL